MEIEPLLAEQAKERQVRTAENRKKDDNLVVQKIVQQEEPQKVTEKRAQNQAATQIGGTNAEYVRKAKKLKKEAPELLKKVNEGTINLLQAEKIAGLGGKKRENLFL